MITDLEQLDTLVVNRLSGITLGGQPVTVRYAEPEEEVVKAGSFPLVVVQLVDERMEAEQPQFYPLYTPQGNLLQPMQPAHKIRWMYQVDLYSQTRQELVHLYTAVLVRMPRIRGHLVDPGGHIVYYSLTDFKDLSKYADEERLYRYALSYELCGWFDPQQPMGDPVGRVEQIRVEYPEQEEVQTILPD